MLDKEQFDNLHAFLDREAARINNPDFIAKDPVQFPRRFSSIRDIEIVSLLSATIAWGNRKMICNNCEKMLTIMEHEPSAFVDSQDYELLPDELNIHRTFFVRNFKYMMRGLRNIYRKHSSINDFARINMALRWLVRDDGIVDMGVWTAISPAQLFIPLDVHVGDTARALGMISRRANDKKTVVQLTQLLRTMRPNDPVLYDYALFGIGIGERLV